MISISSSPCDQTRHICTRILRSSKSHIRMNDTNEPLSNRSPLGSPPRARNAADSSNPNIASRGGPRRASPRHGRRAFAFASSAVDGADMRILLTGGAGFIGSHVTELLERKYPSYTVRRLNARSNASILERCFKHATDPSRTDHGTG